MTDVRISSDKWEISSVHSEDEAEKNFPSNGTGHTIAPANGSVKPDNRNAKKPHRKTNQRLTRKLWKVFSSQTSTPPGGKVTPVENDEEHESDTPRIAVIDAFTKKSIKSSNQDNKEDNISLAEVKPATTNSRHYQNQAFIQSESYPESTPGHKSGRISYEAAIYSVNSAGRPVPITIEESENDELQDDDYSRNDVISSHTQDCDTPIVPSASSIFPRPDCCCFTTERGYFTKAHFAELWQTSHLPSSNVMFAWLGLLTAAFLYNLWTIPLRATFISDIQTPHQDLWFALDAICDLIYVVDIFMKFRTCYIQSGVFVTDRGMLNRYHRREKTLILDILAILPTDFVFLHNINPYFRLNRILKLHRVYRFYQFGELSTWAPNFWRSLTLLHILFVTIHYNACIYFTLSSRNGFGPLLTSWSYPNPKFFPEYEPLYRRYTYSFYWCMVGLGLVNDRYFPEADWQFTFSIYLHFVGMAFLVIFIGFFTVVIWGQLSRKFKFEKTMRNTNDYLRMRKLPKDLRSRVMRFYQYSWLSEQFPHLDEGSILKSLPIAVRQEIELHSKFNALKQISSLARCDDKILRDLVLKLQRTIFLPGQFVFKSGDLGKDVYIVGEGILEIVNEGDPNVRTLRDGDVFGEIDFLRESEKRRTADVISYGYSEVYTLNCEDVWEALRKYPKFLNQVQRQDKSRRAMSAYGRECRAFGTKYQSLPTSSVKSRDSKLSSSKVNFQLVNRFHGNSPDSGMPSTPSMGMPCEGGTPTLDRDKQKSEVPDKVADLFQEHVKSLKTSLESIWYQEVAYLRQRLEDTEQERDVKAREISRLRRQVSKDTTNQKFPAMIEEHSTEDNLNEPTTEKGTDKDSISVNVCEQDKTKMRPKPNYSKSEATTSL